MSFTANRPFMIYIYTYVGFHDHIEAQYMQQFHDSPVPTQSFPFGSNYIILGMLISL